MCGIAGYMGGGLGEHSLERARQLLRRMGDAIAYRGPDGEGQWHDAAGGVALVHRRLAIVDLSPAGNQPMHSGSGRFVIVFNGEIYNHIELRASLPGPWRGHSDTESLLAGFDAWGIEATLQRAVGMFALAVWDRSERRLTLARDRLGEKPLYYGWQAMPGSGPLLMFGSDLNALRAHPAFSGKLDRGALRGYLRYGNYAGTSTVYEGVFKLPPGSTLALAAGDVTARPRHFWRGEQVVADAWRHPVDVTPAAATTALEALLSQAVGQQMVADVPLGAFLSGGIDSSLIAALMQKQSATPIQTYSIGFREASYNEAEYAAAVARHLGTAHTELYVTPQDALDIVPALPTMFSEPFADSSQIPTHLLSRLTRRHVTVALSGDGGDELFCGYNRYLFAGQMWHRLARWPRPLRRVLAALLHRVPTSAWDRLINARNAAVGGRRRWAHVGEKVHKVAQVAASKDLDDLYLGLTSLWPDPGSLAIGGEEPPTVTTERYPELRVLSDVEQMMALDLVGYMCDDVLHKVDRSAMAASLETRAPFLDHRVVEFAWSLPQSLKLRDGHSKWLLREVLYRHVPRALIERPKSGFTVPLADWLRGPLRHWAEALLEPGLLRRQGYLRPEPISRCWQEHLTGKRRHDGPLWAVLMFQAWLEAHAAA
jgi:asparagine synthase (glutamine-hydrolysing)